MGFARGNAGECRDHTQFGPSLGSRGERYDRAGPLAPEWAAWSRGVGVIFWGCGSASATALVDRARSDGPRRAAAPIRPDRRRLVVEPTPHAVEGGAGCDPSYLGQPRRGRRRPHPGRATGRGPISKPRIRSNGLLRFGGLEHSASSRAYILLLISGTSHTLVGDVLPASTPGWLNALTP